MIEIEAYSAGHMTVQGQKHKRDLKIIGNQVIPNWWRKEGHRLDVSDVTDILSALPEVLVVGMGYARNMRVEKSLQSRLDQDNIQLIAQDTTAAVATFNRLQAEEKNVAGAFHLTC